MKEILTSHIHIDCILFLSIHVRIAIIALKSPKKLLRLCCRSPLASSLGEYLEGTKKLITSQFLTIMQAKSIALQF